jgi:ubiquinone/menaquinone biosynthesis C-methylase UbiE
MNKYINQSGIGYMFNYIKDKFKIRLGKSTILSINDWENRQLKDELDFWKEPDKFEPLGTYSDRQEKYYKINKNMFSNLKMNFEGKIICDIGCGPYLGFLPYTKAKTKFAIDPLIEEYNNIEQYSLFYNQHQDIILLNVLAEKIPLISNYVDACYCMNSLDHMVDPYQALKEMIRILKKGGYFALSVDINGTPDHPHKILEKDLDKYLLDGEFEIIEKRCSSKIESSWPKEFNIPLYVFQGYKLRN